MGTRPARHVRVTTLPAFTLVARPIETALLGVRLDRRVYQLRIGGCHREADLSHVAAGQALLDPSPTVATVRRLENSRVGAAGEQRPDVAPPLVRRGVHHVRVRRIELHVGDTRVLVDLQDRDPRLAAIGRLVHAPLPAGRPQRAFGGNQHDVSVPRIDEDLSDVFRPFEPHPLPRPSGVAAAIHSVSPAEVPAAHVLAGPDPYDVRVGWVEGHDTDRIGRLFIEHGLPRRAGVGCLPQPARAHCDVPRAAIPGIDGDVGDAAAHEGRTDAAKREPTYGLRDRFLFRGLRDHAIGSG